MWTSPSSATRQSKWLVQPWRKQGKAPVVWLSFLFLLSPFYRSVQICLQGWVWKVQALHDDNPDVWSHYLPLLPQLPVRKHSTHRAPGFGYVTYGKLGSWCFVILSIYLLFRVTDEIFNFLLVWYYCTLTIRESILMSNGSRWALSPFLFNVAIIWNHCFLFFKYCMDFYAVTSYCFSHFNFFFYLFFWCP